MLYANFMKKNIKDILERIDEDYFSLLKKIGKVAKEENLKAYLVGGMVRDLLLGFDNLDIDIVVENNAARLADALIKNIPSGEFSAKHDRFHTAKVIININEKKIPVDLASTREETYAKPAALPDVTVSTLENDLRRRDFTINALAVSLLPNDFGDVVDYFEGLEDLIERKRIKILHPKSFIDDPTRMIRAVRFAVKLGFEIEENTKKLLETALDSKQFDNLIEKIRGDRVKIEIRYFLKQIKNMPSESNVKELLDKLLESGIYRLISTDLKFNVVSELWNATKYIPRKYENQWLIYLALFIKHLDSEKQLTIMNNLQLISDEISIISKAFVVYKKLLSYKSLDSMLVYKELKALRPESIILIDSLFVQHTNIASFIEEYINKTSKIKLFISGQDLISMGVPSSKRIGEILEKVLEKKISHPEMKREEEEKLARELI